MDCQECREVLSAALDGEAAPAERAAAGAHAAGCPDCSRYAADADRVTRLARVGPAEQMPDVAGTVLAALGVTEPAPAPAPVEQPVLTCVSGGCCDAADAGPAPAGSACGCLASCGCGCQEGAPCRCGTRAA
ncbi:zf-HC2 domain-containing protein [Pseudonocardia sp. HH130630-07]|uniref:zf-HC2 domain-containing protein n=1 Tax=Pseudonocardia sp. HH130630-07 TaxID=1690815 RepID=UPI000815329F|nr:zf-HC2 domain-containing protein [Pseudonocardia sp. HH130630-07]ANY08500.1 hypothetical protein AFB00_22005 [Pseudonocardia sp. HH130630-07]